MEKFGFAATGISVVKLTKKQSEKLALLQGYLKENVSGGMILLANNNATYITSLRKIYVDAISTELQGYGLGLSNKMLLDRIAPYQITEIYRAALKADESFNLYCQGV